MLEKERKVFGFFENKFFEKVEILKSPFLQGKLISKGCL